VRAIETVHAGDGMLSPAITSRLIALVAAGDRAEDARERLAALTEREREVALAVGRGASNAEIAAELFMSVATVKAYVSRLLAKLDLDNRVQIALLVHDAGRSWPPPPARRDRACAPANCGRVGWRLTECPRATFGGWSI